MSSPHWSDEQLIAVLYGAGQQDGHAAACPDCRARLSELASQRERLRWEPMVSAEFLAEQRRSIRARMEARHVRANRWVPACAVAAVLTLGVLVVREARTPAPPPAVSDRQLFSEIDAIEQAAEPRAASAVRSLFSEN